MKKAQANKEHVLSVFFDIEIPFDLTRRHGVLKDLNDTETAGKMFNFIQIFLKPRSLKVKISEGLSDTNSETGGIPKRRAINLTCFTLKINKIVVRLPTITSFQIYLYMDNLQMLYRHSGANFALENCINFSKKNFYDPLY